MKSAPHAPLPREADLSGDALAGLGVLHSLSLAVDASGRILWMSDDLHRELGASRTQVGDDWMELVAPGAPGQQRYCLHRELLGRIGGKALRVELENATGVAEPYDVSAMQLGDASCLGLLLRPLACRALPAEPQLRAQNDALRAVLDALPDAVLALDPSGHVFFANAEASRLLGRAPHELRDRPIAQLLARETDLTSVARCVRLGAEAGEQTIDFASCTRHHELVLRARNLDLPGAPPCQVLTLSECGEDVVERKRLEHKVAELESYVHSVSHDLRSPLVSLLGFTRLLQQDYEDLLDETGRHFLHRIEQAVHSMDALISDLLEISKIGRPGEQRDLVDPRSVLLQLHAELKPRLEEQGVELLIPSDPPLLLCNRTRLYQVFSNLVGNALAHMGPCDSPQIRVSICADQNGDHVVVQDNGRGIDFDAQQRIFEMFQTLRAKDAAGGSTGMGLAIVKKIAETHGGSAWVESQPGSGASFHVTLAR